MIKKIFGIFKIFKNMKSRKAVILAAGICSALSVYLEKELGIKIGLEAAAASFTGALVYIFGEMKNDFARVKTRFVELKKWLDPAFWGGMIAVILPVLSDSLGWKLPVTAETVSFIVSGIMTLIFGNRLKKNRMVTSDS